MLVLQDSIVLITSINEWPHAARRSTTVAVAGKPPKGSGEEAENTDVTGVSAEVSENSVAGERGQLKKTDFDVVSDMMNRFAGRIPTQEELTTM